MKQSTPTPQCDQPSPEQLVLLRRMLGIDNPRKRVPTPYKNYAEVKRNDPQFVAMAAAGWVQRYDEGQPPLEVDYYECTETGKLAALNSYKSIRWPKPKRLYYQFLIVRDSIPELTFKQFITRAEFAQMRKDA